ncbi:hypothetical protein BGZ63DRAFT_427066 [Mariannaea sp. PMI_226]|nr:hypothetical protein BGZ63DRAFT_427066 [Mariannaea sp. PMI_226]
MEIICARAIEATPTSGILGGLVVATRRSDHGWTDGRLKQPRQQSVQDYMRCIYDSIKELRDEGNVIEVMWLPTSDNKLLKLAKVEARKVESGPFGCLDRSLINYVNMTITILNHNVSMWSESMNDLARLLFL